MTRRLILLALTIVLLLPVGAFAQSDPRAGGKALSTISAGFEVKFYAKDLLVRQPCSITFDAEGRLFVGMELPVRNTLRYAARG